MFTYSKKTGNNKNISFLKVYKKQTNKNDNYRLKSDAVNTTN